MLVVRKGKIIEETIPQWYAFNLPQQLGNDSPDQPEDSDCMVVNLEEDDVVIMASDGVYDNLSVETILAEVQNTATQRPRHLY